MENSLKIRKLTYVALFAVVMAICAQIMIPGPVPFTMQTFGVFIAVGVLGGQLGSAAVFLYLLMGAVGLPVFAGMKGGLGALVGVTGGYIFGFLASALVMWGMEKLIGRKPWALAVAMVAGLLACYALGTGWFLLVYTRNTGAIGLWAVLLKCVIPYIIPDLIKAALALALCSRLSAALKLHKGARHVPS